MPPDLVEWRQPASAQVGEAFYSPGPPSARRSGGDALELRGQVRMPLVGLGTWLTTGAECTKMVAAALRAGIRAIDTSENYANHEAIGAALRESNVPRAELFLADKISFAGSYSRSGVRAAVAKSLQALGTTYLDLLMLHSIGPSPSARMEAWREMEALKAEGVVRAIGTSNFGTREMGELRAATSEPPAVHQIKFNVYHQGRTGNAAGEDFAADCAAGGCVVMAYCPLNAWPSKLAPVDDKIVGAIARRLGRTPAQVLLRWVLQRGAVALTRSRDERRLRDALAVKDFALSESDMAVLSGLSWLVESETNRPPPAVVDALGVVSAHPREPAGAAADNARVEL